MARLTRNSYKRKIILFGVFVFMSIALISTGFATWVMSSDDKEQNTGNVEVGVVADSSVNITITNVDDIKDFEFAFEPNSQNSNDLIHAREENGKTKLEHLKLIIEGNVTGTLKDVNIEMILPAGVATAINEGYINTPIFTFYKSETDCASEENGTLINTMSTEVGYENTYTFKNLVEANGGNFVIAVEFSWGAKFDVEFSWGTKFDWGTEFDGANPCDIYNEVYAKAKAAYATAKTKYESTGSADDYEDMAEKLDAMNEIKEKAQEALANLKLLRAHIYGYFDLIGENKSVDELAADPQYKSPIYVITITALAN